MKNFHRIYGRMSTDVHPYNVHRVHKKVRVWDIYAGSQTLGAMLPPVFLHREHSSIWHDEHCLKIEDAQIHICSVCYISLRSVLVIVQRIFSGTVSSMLPCFPSEGVPTDAEASHLSVSVLFGSIIRYSSIDGSNS